MVRDPEDGRIYFVGIAGLVSKEGLHLVWADLGYEGG